MNDIVLSESMDTANNIPVELRVFDQWVCYEQDKVPIDPKSGGCAKTNDSDTWSSYETALGIAAERGLLGVGFVLTEDDTFCVVDLDGCIVEGELLGWAAELLDVFGDTYTEVSKSGTGLHIVVRGTPPRNRKRLWRDGEQGIEVYAYGQYIAMTGDVLSGTAVRDCQDSIDWLFSEFPEPEIAHEPVHVLSLGPGQLASATVLDDERLLMKMRTAGSCEKFRALFFAGDISGYGSRSEADLALCGMLAFWTGKDSERMDRFFRKSALMRPKWDERHFGDGLTYGQNTLTVAIQNCLQVYDVNKDFCASDEVLKTVDSLMHFALTDAWKGHTGATQRKVYIGLLQVASKHGRPHEEGIKVARSVRDLALDSGCAEKTVSKNIKRLKGRGLLKTTSKGSSHNATIYLLNANVPHKEHSHQCVNYGVLSSNKTRRAYTPPLEGGSSRALSVSTISPRAIQVMDFIHACDGAVSLETLCKHLQSKRKSDVRSRLVRSLLDEGLIIEVEENVYDTPPDIEERFETHLERSNSNARSARHEVQILNDRERWAEHQTREAVAKSS